MFLRTVITLEHTTQVSVDFLVAWHPEARSRRGNSAPRARAFPSMANNDAAILFFAYAVTSFLVFGFSARLGFKRLDLPGFVCTVSRQHVAIMSAPAADVLDCTQPIACLTLVFENVVLGIEFLTDDLKGMSTVLSTRFVVHCTRCLRRRRWYACRSRR